MGFCSRHAINILASNSAYPQQCHYHLSNFPNLKHGIIYSTFPNYPNIPRYKATKSHQSCFWNISLNGPLTPWPHLPYFLSSSPFPWWSLPADSALCFKFYSFTFILHKIARALSLKHKIEYDTLLQNSWLTFNLSWFAELFEKMF